MNRITCDGDAYERNTPTFETTCQDAVFGYGTVRYDIPAATIFQSSQAVGPVGAHLTDDFTFHGPSPGSTFTFRLRARFRGWAWDGGSAFVALRPFFDKPGDPVVLASFSSPLGARLDFADSLDMVLTRTAGPPIGLEVESSVFAAVFDYAECAVEFEFVDLPPGWAVTSCNGFVQEAPVPVAPSSWGRVKAGYR